MNQLLVNVTTRVNRSMIRRESRNGDEFVIIRSATLPDDVIMNGGLYPGDEIDKSFMTLNGTLAPLEHPTDGKGNFVPAASQYAIDNYYVGAANENVSRENGRVYVDKAINVRKALESDKGKRLMDRISALEEGGGEPIHTSTGVFLQPEELPEPMTANAGPSCGQEYTWIARNMKFDHDAILLDEPGAATPEQGVGIAVNSEGSPVDVQYASIDQPPWDDPSDTAESLFKKLLNKLGFADGSRAAYNSDSKYLHNEGDPMKDKMMSMLKKANMYKEGMSDEEMMNAYGDMMMKKGMEKNMGGKKNMDEEKNMDDKMKKNSDDLADRVLSSVKELIQPLAEEIQELKSNKQQEVDAEKQKYIDVITNAAQGYSEEDLKAMPVTALSVLATNCATPKPAQMLNTGFAANAGKDTFDYSKMEAPE